MVLFCSPFVLSWGVNYLAVVPLVLAAFGKHFFRPRSVLPLLHCKRETLKHVGFVGVTARETCLAALFLRSELHDLSVVDVAVVQYFDYFFRKASGHSRVLPSELRLSHPETQADDHPRKWTWLKPLDGVFKHFLARSIIEPRSHGVRRIRSYAA